MINAVHTLIYSDDPAATRVFFRDVLKWPYVADEGSGGEAGDWLTFRSGRSELGVHPTSSEHDGQTWSAPRHHEMALMCDDLASTMSDLSARGASFAGEPADRGFGVCVMVHVPGADDIMLYQPTHRVAYGL